MPDLIFDNAKYSSWNETYNFENCKLNRKAYGKFLIDFITGEKDGFVLNLNGTWGAGKTEFLKRMYTELITRNHPCIYIDAWESDFSKDPLTVVTSELLNQLKLFNSGINGEEANRKLNKFFAKALKGTAIGVAGGLTKLIIGDGTVGASAMQEWVSEDPDEFIDTITNEYHEQVDAIKKIRENLTTLATVLNTSYGSELPIVVLVDELDRCRPTYAIEMLEVIKHFFKTKHFIFVVATDTEQLSHSIKAVYGQDFESKSYLKRFFDRKATLPTPNIESYLTACSVDYSPYNTLKLYPNIYSGTVGGSINKVISLLAIAYELQIRDIDQLLSKFHSCLRSAVSSLEITSKAQYINYPALLIGLIEQEKSEAMYNSRTRHYAPEPTIFNANYKVSDEFSLIDFITQSMKNITFSEYTYQGNFGDEITKYILPSERDFRLELNNSTTQEYRNFIIETMNHIQYGNLKGDHKHWDWDDMKKVIELAGTIE